MSNARSMVVVVKKQNFLNRNINNMEIDENNLVLTPAEAKIIGIYFDFIAKWEREDIIGILMKFGAFKYLENDGKWDDRVVSFARKIEKFKNLNIDIK